MAVTKQGFEDDAKADVAAVETEASKVNSAIDAWFVAHFHGTKIAAETELFNLCHKAKEELKTILAKL